MADAVKGDSNSRSDLNRAGDVKARRGDRIVDHIAATRGGGQIIVTQCQILDQCINMHSGLNVG